VKEYVSLERRVVWEGERAWVGESRREGRRRSSRRAGTWA
jgi:hypothetical protein